MAGEKTQVEIDAQIDAGIKVNGNKEITPPIHNAIEKALSNSYVNKKDGGNAMEASFGQLAYIEPTIDTHFTPKKYVDDLMAVGFKQGGNSFAAAAVLGTNDLYDLLFETNSVSRGGVDSTGKWMFGLTTPIADTHKSNKSHGNTSATWAEKWQDSDGALLMSLDSDGLLFLNRISIGVYGSQSETIAGQAYIIGNSVIAHPTNNNEVIKTSADTGIWIRSRYDKGITFHTGLTGSTGTIASDDYNQVLTIDNSGYIYGGVIANGETPLICGRYIQISAAETAAITDQTIECTANTFTVTLYTAVGYKGRDITISNQGTGVVTVDGSGTETINGALTQTLNQYDSMILRSNGTNWIIVASF